MASLRTKKNPANINGINSSMSIFLVLYVNEILLIKNDILYITGNKGFTIIIVLHKRLGKSIPHPRDEDL